MCDSVNGRLLAQPYGPEVLLPELKGYGDKKKSNKLIKLG